MLEHVSYTPVPSICKARVLKKIADTETYEISIYHSPIGAFSGPVYATCTMSPGSDDNLQPGDHVHVFATFTFGGVENKYLNVHQGSPMHILGTFNERSVSTIKVQPPLTQSDKGAIRFVNKKSGAGVVATETGKMTLASGGSVFTALDPYGFGVGKDAKYDVAQNHHRVVSGNQPYYATKEYFGMFSGSTQEEESMKMMPEDHCIVFRRFVQQSKDLSKWVSTCEGAYSPWFGPNNDLESVTKHKEVLFSKIVNQDTSRITIEMGAPGESFLLLRVDDVILGETMAGDEIIPATLGNRFKLTVSDKGAVNISTGGQAIPMANMNKVNIKMSEDGELTINSSGKMSFSHGDNDASINSIVLDPAAGVDITAKNGFRVNGSAVVTEKFVDWFTQNQANLCIVSSIGGPAPMHPIAIPGFTLGANSISDAGGFTTKNIGMPAMGIMMDPDSFFS